MLNRSDKHDFKKITPLLSDLFVFLYIQSPKWRDFSRTKGIPHVRDFA